MTDTYPLGRSAAESRRLVLQHQIYGPLTRQFLVGAGITTGMRVLDLGSGAGDVALLLAELVGPQGHVVGVDMSPEILQLASHRADAAGWENITFRPAQLEPLDLGELDHHDHFDAIVGRWVLMYLAEPATLLNALRDRLRPGGIVAFQESDLTEPLRSYPPAPLHEQVARHMLSPVTAPPDREMGLKLYRTFIDSGLPAPRLWVNAPAGGGPDWPGYAYTAATLHSVQHLLTRPDGGTDELDLDTLEGRLRDEILTTDGIQILTTVIGAWTRT